MGLKEQLVQDMKEAMKSKDSQRLDTIRLLRASIQRLEVDRTDRKNPNYGKEITEQDYVGVVQKEIKQRRDSIEAFEKGGRQDLADKERAELEVMEQYLPKQLSREEIVAAVQPIIEREGKDFRKVMPIASKELKGQADGRLVSEVVKELTA
ncbi:MAG TPA: GatB/YqeY domain-containing protein [Chloroflexia bacterium]|nr:GatB/YqeY domain-containing protein [Chloroflexia bacterium]